MKISFFREYWRVRGFPYVILHTHKHTHLHTFIHSLSHTHTHTYTLSYTLSLSLTHTHTHTHTHIHTHTHTHIHAMDFYRYRWLYSKSFGPNVTFWSMGKHMPHCCMFYVKCVMHMHTMVGYYTCRRPPPVLVFNVSMEA